jgi:uncharacterized protein YbaP (TraB family)
VTLPRSIIGAPAREPEGRLRRTRRAPLRTAASALIPLIALLLGCAARTPAPPASPGAKPTPLLWRASPPRPGDGTIHLFGSVHVGGPERAGFGRAVEAAFAAADELVVEVDLSLLSEAEIAEQTLAFVLLPPGQSLRDRISPDTWELLASTLRDRDVALAALASMKPWAVTTFLVMQQFEAAGLDPEHGVDRRLIARASGVLPIRGLETLQSQLTLLDGLPPAIQDLMLADTLRRMDDDPNALLRAWERGDEAELEGVVFASLQENPEYEPFYEALFFGRNRAMAGQLAGLVGDGRRRFVVLGAGHMLGPRGIPALLASRGFRVERVDVR